MYFSNGNYEAFARPRKPKNVDQKSAYFVGGGLASLAGAAFLIRDGQMKGENIHIFEELALPGGSMDGIENAQKGFIIRGGREMEDHFECLWDLYRSIPSIETEGASVLDEYYWLNKDDPNYSLMRIIENRGQPSDANGKFNLTDNAVKEIPKIFLTREADLEDVTIEQFFSKEFLQSNFWLYWRTMFAFEEWHSALEMKRYLQRFTHSIQGLKDLSTLKFTKYNQYDSLILPLVKYLEEHGVHMHYDTSVENIIFDINMDKKIAKKIILTRSGKKEEIDLTENELVFITNGSMTENSTYGDNNTPAPMNTSEGTCWQLWKNIAKQDKAFGNPEKFCSNIDKTNWLSATVTCFGRQIPDYIQKISKRDPAAGKVVTGGIVTAKDSSWLLSYTVNRQPHFKTQSKDETVVWVYGLFTDKKGDYIKKAIKDCTGNEIVQEWLYHMGVPTEQISEMSKSTNSIPCMMPYITSQFMPRKVMDRPNVIPDGCVNAAFIGQYAETERDCVFTTEYSVRTAMIAVYTLLGIERGIPEVFASQFDIRTMINSSVNLLDGRKPKLGFFQELLLKIFGKKLENTEAEDMLKKYKAL